MAIQTTNFDQLFEAIRPEDITDNVFTLVGKVFPVITAGTIDHYNSMVGSGGGMGLLFKQPTTWCILRTDRYTLQLMQKVQTYTLSFFPDEHMKHIGFLGSKSGRDSDKMKESELTSVQTPAGNISYAEARLIVECTLTLITTPQPEEFCTPQAKEYVNEAYKDPNDVRKFVFGEITHVWVKKSGL